MASLTEIEAMIALYTNAEREVLEGKSVSFGGRTLTMESLGEIRAGRKEWERKKFRSQPGGNSPAQATFE
ncbi:hypothetical protein [Ferrimonas aestuarii]|uniref:Primosomal replication protein PriB/PriC domain protein n=1 Tax=Ferrimonas aestuarii TaxID=2569539 RepID=A0A4U1BN59_9GAMM|nr:hypothetical protein [Ferrimonas aestuarii]TKB53299.1 hypothetical protein FCL42_14605 [Ferrimonas aestuarii]